MVTSFVSFWDAYWLIVIVNRMGEGWQEKKWIIDLSLLGGVYRWMGFLIRYSKFLNEKKEDD